jgi:hypothetical protein
MLNRKIINKVLIKFLEVNIVKPFTKSKTFEI